MEWKQLLNTERFRAAGRAAGTPDPYDLRSPFEKDYHRIIGSASFRRLQDKTQVFPLDRGDFVRTRLTHSLETASLSRSLGASVGRALSGQAGSGFAPENTGDISTILECAGLLHDIGNPPFGHFGEDCIRDWFARNLSRIRYVPEGGEEGIPLPSFLTKEHQADFLHFEGNAQALRVATKLHYLVDAHGMNLTKGLLGAMVKYPGSASDIDPDGPVSRRKMGYFQADADTFAEIERACGLHGLRHPLAFLLEAADDIAYHTADIEDACRKGFLDLGILVSELERSEDPSGTCAEQAGRLAAKYEEGKALGREDPGFYAVQNWLIGVQGLLLKSAAQGFLSHYGEIMDGSCGEEVFAGTSGERLNLRLGEIADAYVFRSAPIYSIEISASRILQELLDRFVQAVLYFDTKIVPSAVDERLIGLISANYRTIYSLCSRGKDEEERLYLRLLLVTDFVCGMTDSYAQSLFETLCGKIR